MTGGMKVFLIGENGERIPYTKPRDGGRRRFQNEAEREVHRKEIEKRRAIRGKDR